MRKGKAERRAVGRVWINECRYQDTVNARRPREGLLGAVDFCRSAKCVCIHLGKENRRCECDQLVQVGELQVEDTGTNVDIEKVSVVSMLPAQGNNRTFLTCIHLFLGYACISHHFTSLVNTTTMALLLESQRPTRKQFRLDDLFDDDSELVDEPTIDRNILKDRARWIRDDLDLEVAREGPNHLTADQVVLLFKFLGQLRQSRVPLEDIRWSRVHHAVGCIAARATRWPRTLIEEAEKVLENWTIRYGDVDEIGSPLYEEGGRLFGVCTPDDVSKEVLEIKWLRAKDSKTVTGYSHRQGDMGFKPGE